MNWTFLDQWRLMVSITPQLENSKAQIYQPSVFLREEVIFVADSARIDALTKLEGGEGIAIGKNCHLASFVHILGGGTAILEEGSSMGSGSKLITGSNIPGEGHGCSAVDPNAVIKRSFVWVKKNAVIFAGAIVLPGVIIGEGAVIAAGAVVRCDVPDGETWGGVPARRLKENRTLPNVNTIDNINPLRSVNNCDDWVNSLAEFYGWPV